MIKCQIIQDGKVKDQIVQMNGLVFCDNHGVERSNSIRTPIVDAGLHEWHYDHFGIMHQHYRGKEDNSGFQVMHEVKPALMFTLATQGFGSKSVYLEGKNEHELFWHKGNANVCFKKAFKQEFGTTVFQYLFDFRMDLAVHYLLDTSLPIADIGIKLGYDYQSHFCTAFKRKHGVSPMEFRFRRGVIART